MSKPFQPRAKALLRATTASAFTAEGKSSGVHVRSKPVEDGFRIAAEVVVALETLVRILDPEELLIC